MREYMGMYEPYTVNGDVKIIQKLGNPSSLPIPFYAVIPQSSNVHLYVLVWMRQPPPPPSHRHRLTI